ncbi:hypothetical protein [Kangiella aquimarina]|uniref:Peptidase n=1 Tax=Kangiella aquimarina TaxID=261965 RepID=A0ABZ0X636_9GAMM|nr:hypothetical protein [Kangiella aquimarina]WQG86056.1 hypothetical protein SR900_03990 [Kangiella aquimarina]
MKAIIAFLIVITLFSTTTQAEDYYFEAPYPAGGSNVTYPGLDLSNAKKIKIKASNSYYDPMMKIDELEIIFENATNFKASNFKYTNGSYRAIVEDAWIYRKVYVEVMTPEPLASNEDIYVSLNVVEFEGVLDDVNMSHGQPIYDAHGFLEDVTPDVLVDQETIVLDGKNLTIQLFKRAKSGLEGEGFKLVTNWHGYGQRTIYLPAPFPMSDAHMFNAVGIELESHQMPDGFVDYSISIKYEDVFGGYSQSGPIEPLAMYIEQAYGYYPWP